jgi:hypothetical protein
MRTFIAITSFVLVLCSCSSDPQPKEKVTARDTHSTKINPHIKRDTVVIRHTNDVDYAGDTAFREFSFLINGHYMLLTSQPDAGWIKGDPQMDESAWQGGYAVTTDVDAAKLPAVFSDLINKKFTLYTGTGEHTEGIVTGFKMYCAVIPHFGVVQAWNGTNEDTVKDSEKEIAADILSGGALYLVAEFSELSKTNGNFICSSFYKSKKTNFKAGNDGPGEDEVMKEAGHSEDFAQNTSEYQERTNTKGDWMKDESTSLKYQAIGGDPSRDYGILTYVSGNPCGGDFFFESSQLWEEKGNGKPIMVGGIGGYDQFEAALDLDGDGFPEIMMSDVFGNERLYKKDGNEWKEYRSWGIPFQDCGC